LLENIPRVLPDGLHARIDAGAWPQPRLMAFLQAQGNIEPEEMARTFNCGVGMAVIVAQEDVNGVTQTLNKAGESVFLIGLIERGELSCTSPGGRHLVGAGRLVGKPPWLNGRRSACSSPGGEAT
jgi:phosphoribosylformylglycinamidine cyclo-ligase